MVFMKNEKLDKALFYAKNWMYKHDIISSCAFTLMIGLAVGGVCVALDRLLV
jgi:hypothetical protein